MKVTVPIWRKALGNILRESGQILDMAGARILKKYAYQDKIGPLVLKFKNDAPKICEGTWIAPSAHVIGNVFIGPKTSIWYGSVLRGDVNAIRVGSMTAIQDRVVIHVASAKENNKGIATHVGDKVTIEPGSILHACTVEDEVKIEAGSIILDGVTIGKHSIIGAGSLVSPGKKIPSGELWEGRPAKFVRKLTDTEIRSIIENADTFVTLAAIHDNATSMTPRQRELADQIRNYGTPTIDIEPASAEFYEKR